MAAAQWKLIRLPRQAQQLINVDIWYHVRVDYHPIVKRVFKRRSEFFEAEAFEAVIIKVNMIDLCVFSEFHLCQVDRVQPDRMFGELSYTFLENTKERQICPIGEGYVSCLHTQWWLWLVQDGSSRVNSLVGNKPASVL